MAIALKTPLVIENDDHLMRARIDALTTKEAAGFRPISPDVAIEVKSDTDDFEDAVEAAKFISSAVAATPSRSTR